MEDVVEKNKLFFKQQMVKYKDALKIMDTACDDPKKVIESFRTIARVFFKGSNIADTMIQKRAYSKMMTVINHWKDNPPIPKLHTELICCICYGDDENSEPRIHFLPCNHVVICNTCCQELKQKEPVSCPVCRKDIRLAIDTLTEKVIFENKTIRGFVETMIQYAAPVLYELVHIANDENNFRVLEDMHSVGVLDILIEEGVLRSHYEDEKFVFYLSSSIDILKHYEVEKWCC
jgi:hypothetical protein